MTKKEIENKIKKLNDEINYINRQRHNNNSIHELVKMHEEMLNEKYEELDMLEIDLEEMEDK